MIEIPRRVFCKDCTNLCRTERTVLGDSGFGGEFRIVHVNACRIANVTFDPVRGEIRTASDPAVRNANLDCPHFTPRGAERIRPDKRKPWWRFW